LSIDDDMPSFAPASNSAAFTPLEIAEAAKRELAEWLDKHPSITDVDTARAAKLVFDRANASFADLERARNDETGPLHKAWQAAIAKFKPTIESFSKFITTLDGRMQAFLREQKRKADEAAAEAARIADEKIRLAREAEAKEREAVDDASQGVIDAGVAQATEEADRAFSEAEIASRTAARAEAATKVRIGGGFSGRAMGLRALPKVQILDDAVAAIGEIGVNDDIREAILKSARAFKKLHNRWPAGVHEEEAK
jgi:hypothetical protein